MWRLWPWLLPDVREDERSGMGKGKLQLVSMCSAVGEMVHGTYGSNSELCVLMVMAGWMVLKERRIETGGLC